MKFLVKSGLMVLKKYHEDSIIVQDLRVSGTSEGIVLVLL
jgi:RNase P/RNase MRP subunit POP5